MQRDTAKSPFAYNDFLTLWKDADPDIPILKEAKVTVTSSTDSKTHWSARGFSKPTATH